MFHAMRNLILSMLALLTFTTLKAQDPEFTQYYANPLYLNPAFAGSNPCPRLTAMHRNQWPAIPGGYITTSTSYDFYSKDLNGGVGLHVLNDVIGDGVINLSQVSAMYSYHMRVDRKWALRAGAEVSYRQKVFNWNRATFGDQIDTRYGFIYNTNEIQRGENVKMMDLAAGMIAHTKKSWIGLSVHHITEPNESFIYGSSRLEAKYSLHAGTRVDIDRGQYRNVFQLVPSMMYRRQGEFNHFNLGLYLQTENLTYGVWYRGTVLNQYNDAMIFTLGLKTEKFNFGYSYDLTVSDLTPSTGGSHEISVRVNIECRPVRSVFREIPCPDF